MEAGHNRDENTRLKKTGKPNRHALQCLIDAYVYKSYLLGLVVSGGLGFALVLEADEEFLVLPANGGSQVTDQETGKPQRRA